MKESKNPYKIFLILLKIAAAVLVIYLLFRLLYLVTLWSTRIGIFSYGILIFLIILYLLNRFFSKEGKKILKFMKSVGRAIKQSVAATAEIKNFRKNHPQLFSFFQNRFAKNKFSGWPLTLLTLLFLYIVFALLGIIRGILTFGPIVEADVRIANLLYAFQNPFFIKIFTWITFIGNWQMIIATALLFSVLLFFWRKRIYIFAFWIVIGGAEAFSLLGKLVFDRPRPVGVNIHIESLPAFPSSHAAVSFALWGFIIYCLYRSSKIQKIKVNLVFIGMLLIMAVGFSRLYLGVHFFSDVWGGFLLGLLWLITGISIVEWWIQKKGREKNAPCQHLKLIAAALIIIEIGLYLILGFRYQPNIKIAQEAPALTYSSTNILDAFLDYQLPRHTETPVGANQEPINLIFIADNDDKLINAFIDSGWFLADKLNFLSALNMVRAGSTGQQYFNAPMTPSFWNGQVHQFGFEKPTQQQTVRERHHTRFWKTNISLPDNRAIYVGTTSLDTGLKYIFAHKISPDIDQEREYVFTDLQNSGYIDDFTKGQFVESYLGKNFAGDLFYTDGKAYVIYLK